MHIIELLRYWCNIFQVCFKYVLRTLIIMRQNSKSFRFHVLCLTAFSTFIIIFSYESNMMCMHLTVCLYRTISVIIGLRWFLPLYNVAIFGPGKVYNYIGECTSILPREKWFLKNFFFKLMWNKYLKSHINYRCLIRYAAMNIYLLVLLLCIV